MLHEAESPRCQVLRAVGGPFLEVSLGTWGPDPVLYQLFAVQIRKSISDQKKLSRNRLGPHVPIKTSRHRPTTPLKRGSEDSQLSGAYALPTLAATRVL